MLCHLLKAMKYSQAQESNDGAMKEMQFLMQPSCFFFRDRDISSQLSESFDLEMVKAAQRCIQSA